MNRRIFLPLIILLCSISAFAQTVPQKINYQAVARDANGDLMTNTSVNVVVSIISGSTTGPIEYSESHAVSTNAYGLFYFKIGEGSVITGTMSSIAWGASDHFLNVQVNGDDLGTVQLVSVPYAFQAGNSSHIGGTQVSSVAPTNGQTLVFNGVSGQWEAQTGSGSAGANSILTSTVEPAGANCISGGYFMEYGTDDDMSGVLDASEVDGSYFVCNGVDGVNGIDGLDGNTWTIGTGVPSGVANVGDMYMDNSTNDYYSFDGSAWNLEGNLSVSGGNGIYGGNGIVPSNTVVTLTDNLDFGSSLFIDGVTGNVGIGVNTPIHRLDVVSNNVNNLEYGMMVSNPVNTQGSATGVLFAVQPGAAYGKGGLVFQRTGTFGRGSFHFLNSNDLTSASADLSHIVMTIDTSGYVGINNTAPSAYLDVNGSFRYVDGTQAAGYVLTSDANGNASWQPVSGSGDNWGTDVVNTSGGILTGDGTIGNPLTLNSVDDADADATNELITGGTLNGTDLEITDAGGTTVVDLSSLSSADNWGSDVVNTDATLTGDGTSISPLSVNGDLTDDQDVTISGNAVGITGGTGFNLSATSPADGEVLTWNNTLGQWESSATTGDNWGSDVVNTDATLTGDGTSISPLSVNGDLTDDQDVTISGNAVGITGGTGFNLSATSPADGEVLTWNNTLGQWESSATTGDNWGSDVVNTDATLTGDGTSISPLSVNGDLTDDQDVTISGNAVGITGGTGFNLSATSPADGEVLTWNNTLGQWESSATTGDNWGSDVVNTDATLTGDGTSISPLSVNGDLTDDQDVTISGNAVGITGGTGFNLSATSPADGEVLTWNNTLGQWESSATTGDNWGSDVVNTDATLTGDGTSISPLSVNGDLTDDQDVTISGNAVGITGGTGFNLSATAPADGEVLTWNNTLGQWESSATTGDNWGSDVVNTDATLTGDGTSISPLSVNGDLTDDQDVTISGNAVGITGGTGFNLSATSPADGEVLTWNNTLGQWESSATTGDNWGSDVVNTDATLTGDGTSISPLSVNGDLTDDQDVTISGNAVGITGGTGFNLSATSPADGEVLTWNNTLGQWEALATSGEANTASNQGLGGVGPYIQKTGVDLEFKNLNTNSSSISITDDVANNEIDIDFDPSVLSIDELGDVVLTSPTSGEILEFDGTNWVNTTSVVTNIYTADGTLTGPRSVTQGANNITYTGGGINPTAVFQNGGALGASIRVESTGGTQSANVQYYHAGSLMGNVGAGANGLTLSGSGGGTPLNISNAGNVGVGIMPTYGKFNVHHTATQAYPSINVNQTDGSMSRIHFTNTPVSGKFWEIGAQTNATDASSGWSVNYYDGSNYHLNIVSYGDGKTAINGPSSNFPSGPNNSDFDVFGTTTLHDAVTIDNGTSSPYTLPVVDGAANYVMQTNGAGLVSWVDPSSFGASSIFANTGTVTSNENGDYTNDDFVFGSPSLTDDADPNHQNRMFFDKSIGAFRAGQFGAGDADANVGQYSSSFGVSTRAEGDYSFAAGAGSSAIGLGSVSMGVSNQASGANSVSLGVSSSASGDNSIAIGSVNNSTGDNGISLGSQITNSGIYSVGIGNTSTITGDGSYGFGSNLTIGGANAMSLGESNENYADYSFTFGDHTRTQTYGEMAIGYYNTDAFGSVGSWVTTDRLFSIGNGTSAQRSDALTIMKDGTTTLNGTLTIDADNVLGAGAGYTLPGQDGTVGYIMQTNGAGLVSWVDPASLSGSSTAWDLSGNASTIPGVNTGSGESFIGTIDASGLLLATNSTPALYIDGFSQKVGIGFTPLFSSTKLQVSDVFSNGITAEVSSDISDAPFFRLLRSRGGVLDGSQGDVQGGDVLGSIDFTGYGVGTPVLGARIEGIATENFGSTNSGSKLTFSTAQNGFGFAAERMVIDQNGHVGINSLNPQSTLEVGGDIALSNATLIESAVVIYLTNATGAPSNKGDIVIINPTSDGSFTLTNTAGHNSVVGVVYESGVPNGVDCKIAISGVVLVNSDGNAVRGQHVITGATTTGHAGSVASPSAGTSIGLWLQNVSSGSQGFVVLK
ncbi:MAG: hypothetical protein H6600_05780 [Flavobacteriales bacterium]|nr:hypothetical protein [Flavobacteriales bacterium]